MTKESKFSVFVLLIVLAYFVLKMSSAVGLWTHEKYVVFEDKEDPLIMNCKDSIIGVDVNCQARLILTNAAFDTSRCTAMKSIKWICEVDLWADGYVDFVASTDYTQDNWTFDDDPWYGPIKKIHINATTSMDSEDQPLDQLSNDQIVTVRIPDTLAVNFSNHKVTWKAIDNCQNKAGCQLNILVKDKKAPTPNCVQTSNEVLIDGSIELWAIEYDENSFDNCTLQNDLYFTFNEMRGPLKDTIIRISNTDYVVNADIPYFFDANGFVGFDGDGVITDVNGKIIPAAITRNINKYKQGDIQKWAPELNSSSRIFDLDDCYNQGPEGLPIKISVRDKMLNTDFCELYLRLISNQYPCGFVINSVDGLDSEKNALYQNEPNPYKDVTRITYSLAEEGLASFSVYNVEGKLIMKRTVDAKKGLNVLELSIQDLGSAKGIVYYQLESGNFTDTKKMVVLE